jgi:hypothetical protein
MAMRRWLAFSVRGLLLLVLALGLALGLLLHKAGKQRRAVAAVKQYGGFVHYDWEFEGTGSIVERNSRSPGPPWLRRLVGDEFFQEVTWVGLIRDAHNGSRNGRSSPTGRSDGSVMPYLRDFPRLKWLQIWKGQASDAGLANLGGLTELEELLITLPEGLTAGGLAHLEGLPRLINLQISRGSIDDACLAPIGKLTGLRSLSLMYHPISDAGIVHLRGLHDLESLRIIPLGRKVTDEGLKSLAEMTKLKRLDISGVPATSQELEVIEPLPLIQLTLAEDAPRPEEGIQRLKRIKPKLSLKFQAMPPSVQAN